MQLIMASDIYLFMGLSYITFGLFKKFKLNDTIILLISIIMYFINYIVYKSNLGGDTYIYTLIGDFIYTDGYCFFPLFGWFVVIALGYYFSKLVNKGTSNNSIFVSQKCENQGNSHTGDIDDRLNRGPHKLFNGELLINSNFPEFDKNLVFTVDEEALEYIKIVITSIRNRRAELNVPKDKKPEILVVSSDKNINDMYDLCKDFIKSLALVSDIIYEDKVEMSINSFVLHLIIQKYIYLSKNLWI